MTTPDTKTTEDKYIGVLTSGGDASGMMLPSGLSHAAPFSTDSR